MSSRIDEIRTIIATNPKDPFSQYGLAMEYKRLGLFSEANQAFTQLAAEFPAYVPQYLMHGNLLVEMARIEEAKQVYRHGILVAEKAQNYHAKGELSQALSQIEDME